MARNGADVYSLPAGSTVTNGDVSDATDINTPLTDIAADLNIARPIVAGGTGATSVSAARANLGSTTVGDAVFIAASTAAARTAIGVVIGTDVQAYDADLAALAALATNGVVARTGAGTVSARTITAGTAISVTNGDGVSGNPTIAVTTAASITGSSNIPTDAAVKTYVDARSSNTLMSSVATTSGTTVDLTSIPSTANIITVMLNGVSLNASGQLLLQARVSGAAVTSGYNCGAFNAGGNDFSTAGFLASIVSEAAASLTYGTLILSRHSGNIWTANGAFTRGSVSGSISVTGQISLAGAIDGIRITSVAGTATFDAGSFSVNYQ